MTQNVPSKTLPFLPFVRAEIDEETIQGVVDVLRSGWITTGPQNQQFEAELSAYCGGRPVRTFNSGTATMEIGLRIAGVGEGDEVITTPMTWVSTSNVIIETGATPVFADIDPVTHNIDLDLLEKAITPRTKAILPVYLSGLPVDMDRLYGIAREHGLRVIETRHRRSEHRGAVRRSAHSATLSRSAFTRTRTSRRSKAARSS